MEQSATVAGLDVPETAVHADRASGYGAMLLTWMTLAVLLSLARWGGGFAAGDLVGAIEEGVARVETGTRGEVGDEVIRKAIRTQRETLTFWSAMRAIDDFLIEPAVLALRAVLVGTAFSAAAALGGRTVQYDRALFECVRAQGYWIAGMAVRLAVLILLRRGEPDVETSLAVFLGPGTHPAAVWLVLRQIEPLPLLGWCALARQGWKRGDAGVLGSATICAVLALAELLVRVVVGNLMGGAMRLAPLLS